MFENNFNFDFDKDKEIQKLKDAVAFYQDKLAVELEKRRAGLRIGYEKGKAVFEQEILRRHREMKISLWNYVANARPMVVLTAPIIYSGIFIIVMLDLFVTVYQHICFRAYGIQVVKRGDYMIFERAHLEYLNALQMLNCAYCSYGNGVVAYAREVFARTEQYWCPIKHAKKMVMGYHERYGDFEEFGDAEAFVERYNKAHNRREKQTLQV
jgi:hypothetical protein